jgi:hypothetical protein
MNAGERATADRYVKGLIVLRMEQVANGVQLV